MAGRRAGRYCSSGGDTEVTCASFIPSKNYSICRATNTSTGSAAANPLQLEIPTLNNHALTDAQDALNSLQERGGSLAAAGIMFVALIVGVTTVFHAQPLAAHWSRAARARLGAGDFVLLRRRRKMVALAFTRWQFARRCREQYEELSRMLREPAFLS